MAREKNMTPEVLALQAAYNRGVEKKLWKGTKQCAIALRMKPTKFDTYFYGYIALSRQQKVVALTQKIDRLVKKREPAETHPLLRRLRQTYARGKKAQAWIGPADCAARIGMNKNTLRSQLKKTGTVLHTRLSESVKETLQKMERFLPRDADPPPMHGPPRDVQELAAALIEKISLKPVPENSKPFHAGAAQIAKGISTILAEAARHSENVTVFQDGITSILQGIAQGCVAPESTTSIPVISAPLSDLLVAGLAEIGSWKKDGARWVPMQKLKLKTVQTKEEIGLIKERLQELRRLLTLLNANTDTSMREYAAQQLGPELRFLVIAIKQAGEVTPRDVQEYLEAIDRAHREAENIL